MQRGQFNPDEDEHIVMRWLQWKIAGQQNGIWVALEKEMNRRDKRIAERWRSILMPRIEKQVFELQNQGLLPKAGKGHTGCSLEDKTILKALFAAYSSGTAAIPSGKGILFTRENIVGVQCIDAGIDTHVRKSKLTCVQYIKQDPLNDAVVQQIAEIPLSPQRAKPLFTIKWTNEMVWLKIIYFSK